MVHPIFSANNVMPLILPSSWNYTERGNVGCSQVKAMQPHGLTLSDCLPAASMFWPGLLTGRGWLFRSHRRGLHSACVSGFWQNPGYSCGAVSVYLLAKFPPVWHATLHKHLKVAEELLVVCLLGHALVGVSTLQAGKRHKIAMVWLPELA